MDVHMKFTFAPAASRLQAGVMAISCETAYTPGAGYGFARAAEPSRNEELRDTWPGDCFERAVPTLLIDVPFGNYQVSVTLGNPDQPTYTVVKAGIGQLMLREVRTTPGQTVVETFAVQVDDGRLKLAFGGDQPGVWELEVRRVAELPTLFLAGDSTVADQASGAYPYAGWGQMLPAFLTADVAVSNHARSGRSSKSFITEGRLNRLWKQLRAGDYLFVQFAHNDEKDNGGGTEPHTTYKQYLREYIRGARERGAWPVLVSAMHRRFFDEGRICNTHGEYPEAMRQLALQEGVPFLDLAAASKRLFEELGEERTKAIFTWLEPNRYPGWPEGARDNTHFSQEGGLAIAGLVADGIRREADLAPLARWLR